VEEEREIVVCPNCKGHGGIRGDVVFTDTTKCDFCRGKGRVLKITKIEYCQLTENFEGCSIPVGSFSPLRAPPDRMVDRFSANPMTMEEASAKKLMEK